MYREQWKQHAALFRGKRADNDEWVTGWSTGTRIISQIDTGLSFEVRPKTITQYIGLKDSEDKKIFDGDIVTYSTPSFSYRRTVRYYKGAFVLEHLGMEPMPLFRIIDGDGTVTIVDNVFNVKIGE